MSDKRLDILARQLERLQTLFTGKRADAPEPVEWAENVSQTRLDRWQRGVLLSTASHLLLLCARQSGKSHAVSLRAGYRAKYLGKRIGVLSPTFRQSATVYNRARTWIVADGHTRLARQTLTQLELAGGGAVVAFPGDRPDLIRGETLDELIIDEASQVKDSLIAAATPMLASRPDATLIYLSTPAGTRGEFHRAWTTQDFWHKVMVKAEECSRISPAFLERQRVLLGPLFRQEYECEFMASPGGIFDPEAIADVFGRVQPLAHDAWTPLAAPERARAW